MPAQETAPPQHFKAWDFLAMAAQRDPELPFTGHTWTAWESCGEAPGRHGGTLSGWALLSGPFDPGDVVAIDQKSNMRHCQAVVLPADGQHIQDGTGGITVGSTSDSELVPVLMDGRVVMIKSLRLARVLSLTPPRVVIMADTSSYRRLARTQVGREDAILEIGSSDGACTHVLSCHAAAVVGIDIADSIVQESRRRHPACHFELLDCFQEPKRFRALIADLRSKGRLKAFVDVGGDRATSDVCRVLACLQQAVTDVVRAEGGSDAQGAEPALIVVKARAMAAAAATACDKEGQVIDLNSWWPGVAALQAPCSARQWKRKLGRARKSMHSSGQSLDQDPEEDVRIELCRGM